MAKKNLYTSSSKENLQNLLNLLRLNAYQPLYNNVTNDYSNIVSNLPTVELPEPTIEELPVQDYSYEDEGFFTKLGNKIKEETGLYIPETNYNRSPFEDLKKLKDYSKQDFKTVLDPTFAFGEGLIQNNIDVPAGKMLLNSREESDLLYQKNFLELQKEMRSAWIKLNQAQLENDQTKIAELSQTYNALEQAYLSGFDSYRELAGKKEYYDKYGKQENANDRIDAINKRLTELALENEELNNDLQSGRQQLHNLQSIYQISPEYKQLESEKWYYQIPRAAGTSATSLIANVGSFAMQAGSRYLANQVIAGYGGIYGQIAAGTAAIIGAGSNIAANLWARDQESLSEVANNYKSNIQQYAYDNNIDINAIAEIGREQLRKVTGQEYSSDQNSSNYRSNEEVFEDMLAYDIATNNTDLDRLTATTKKNLLDIYDRNMVLATSDIAQSAMIIPGAGKTFSRVLNKLNLPERAIDGTVKIIDKAIDYTISKQISNAARKGISKYIIDPAVRIAASAGLEGLEETTQYLISSNINKEGESKSINWYNPFDITKVFVQNQYDGLKGLAAIAGVSGDPALDDDEELVNNFKVGAALGLLIGGSFQAVSATKNYKNYNAGRELARNTISNYIQAKEDIFKYKQYAEKAMNNSFNKDAFFEGMDEQFNLETLPDGFTQEDLNNEKNNIELIYNIVNNNRTIKKLNKQDRSTGAALLKHYYDEYQNAYNSVFKNNNNPELNNKVEQDILEFIELNNISEDKRNIIREYLLLSTLLEAYNDYETTLSEFNDTEYANSESKSALDELYLQQAKLKKELNTLNDYISLDKELYKILNENVSLNKAFQEVKDDTIKKFVNNRELRKAKDRYVSLLNDSDKLKEAISKYNSSQESNKQSVIDDLNNNQEEQTTEYSNPDIDEEEIEPITSVVEQTTDNKLDVKKPTVELTSENNSDELKETVTPEASPSVITEESKKELPKVNLLEEASFYDEEDYSEIDSDEQIFDDNLTEEDFIEQPDLQPELTVEPEDKLEFATEPISVQDIELSISDNIDNESTDIEIIPNTNSITFDNNTVNRLISQNDIEDIIKYDNDSQYEESLKLLVDGTLFYQFSDTPLKSGYESGNALNELLSTPGNISKAKFTAFVEPSDYEYGKYNPTDKSTWDNAAVRIEITSSDNRKFITSLKTIEGAEMLYLSRGEKLSEQERNRLRDLRNTIIEAKLNNPNAEITFKNISFTNGRINKQSENRNLKDIEGLDIPFDLHNLFNADIKFGIGKGIIGNFMIVDQNGMPLNGRGGSGKIFIYPSPKNTITGEQVPIQLNEERFANEDGTPTELAKYLANLFVYRDSGDPGLYFEDLQQLILNYGESSLLKPGDPREDFLADKQFYINYKEGWAQLGRDKVNVNQLKNEAGVTRVAQFIADNLHWNTEKNLLWESLPKSFKDYLLDNNLDSVEIVPGLTFDLEDVGLIRKNGRLINDPEHPEGLSTLAWMIKYGKLKSNVADRLFTEPFIYVGEPIITLPKQEVIKNVNILEQADFGTEDTNDYIDFNVYDAKERVLHSKLLNKNDIKDVFSSVDSNLTIVIKNKFSDKIEGIIEYSSKKNRFTFRVQPIKGYKFADFQNNQQIMLMFDGIDLEIANRIINKYIPKDLQQYFVSGAYKEDDKKYIYATDFLEQQNINTIKLRVQILKNTNIGSLNYLRDKYGIYFINEYTDEDNVPTSKILNFEELKEKYSIQSEEQYDPFTDPYSKEVMDFFNFDAPTKRMKPSEVERLKKINTVKAKKWLKSKLGLEEDQIDIVDGVIRQFANGEAVYGIANADGIAISNTAIEGVQYHEAWHRVSLLYLDKDTRNKLYTEFKKLYPKLSKVSNKVLEESMADSFMDYMLNDKESKFRYYINKIFRNIKKLLGLLTKLGNASLNDIFKMIKYGDFSKYKMNEESLKSFMDSYKDGAFYKVGKNGDVILKYFPTIHEFESALDSLKSCLFIANGTKYLSDISNLDNNKLKLFLQNYSKSKFVSEELRNALNEIIDNFDTFMYHLLPRLEQMGIRAIEQNVNEDFQDRELTGILNYDKASYEFDKKNNALASVKMFIATLADTYFDENNVLRTRTNAITGLPMIVDYDEAYSLILNNLSTVENYSPVPGQNPNNSLLGRCAELSKFNPFFAFLYKRLNSVLDSNLETQILQTIKSFNLNFIETAYSTDSEGNAVFTVKDTINKQATKTFPSTWSDLFFNSDLIILQNDGIYPNVKKIAEVINEYNKLFDAVRNNTIITNSDARNYINDLVKILNRIGIDVDEVTIEGLLDQTNRIESLKSLITSTQRGSLYHLINGTIKSTMGGNQTYTVKGVQKVRSLDTVYIGLGVNNIIYELSQVLAITHPNDTGISALGPNNNLVYTKTLNCYVSDLIRWLNQKDERTITNLNSDPYCRSSLILQSANNNNYLRLNTFLNFYGDQSGDKGRDYLSISPVEDYINKINLTWNNHIIFPTMADKKTWFTITGVDLFNKEMFIRQDGNKLKLQFNRDALRYLYSAWEDEYNAIVNYYNTLSSVKEPIKNYHTSGKGGLFRHFTGYYINKNGLNIWIDLNAQIKEALAFDKKHKSSLMLRSILEQIKEDLFTNPVQTYNKINNNLLIELQNELRTCEELGIIQRDENNSNLLKNKLLDSRIFDHFVNIYKANVNPNIAANAERYAIFTIIGNHMINQNISTLETEKIITGDVAFYKNDDDKIKRLGAVLSTGDNLRTQWLTNDPNKTDLYRKLNNRDTYTCAIFNDNEIPSSQYELIKDLFEYDNFRNLLIERENLSESQVDELMKDETAAKNKYPELAALAETLSIDDANAYGLNGKKTKGNINQADAAVYIRPEMYELIVRRLGEWSPEVEEAFRILESDEDWLSDKELYAKSLKTLIKALKTTYFGYTYNADLGYNVPVFNKMAMFPMFKALATGDNREIYDRMNAIGKYAGLQPIDQIAFESAVKVGIEGGFNFYSDYTNNSINDMTNIHTTTQYFRNLRRQLITDPHTHDRTLFGTQVSTVAVSNLIMDRVYGDESNAETQRTGQQLKEQLFGTINALSNKGMQSVRSEFMSDGLLNLNKTSKSLIREAHLSNMGKNIEDALLYNSDEQDFEVSLAALPDSKWVETKIIANTNHKAIDLELPGGAFIQMSSFGFKSIKTVGSDAIANGKRLVNINEDGSMDAIISINLFRHVIPNFDKISFTEAKEWLKKAGIIYDKENPNNSKPIAIGYRIPTQGLSSIAGLRIKDVLPSNVGDMIVLPDEFTTQTGSDFDVDKLYIARYNFDKDGNKIEFKGLKKIITTEGYILEESFEQYLRRRFAEENEGFYEVSERGSEAVDKLYNSWLESISNPKNVYEANSREANENLLLDTYLTVLTDKKVVDQTRLPLDKVTGIIKDEILPIVDGKVNKSQHLPFKELSPTYQMNKKYEYSGGKTGIGPFALNNKNHILTQLAKLRFKDNPLLKALGFTGLDGINSRDELVYHRDKNGNIIYLANGGIDLIEDKGLRILDWISAMINAHVDVAKDPYVIRLNVRQYTYNICNFLLRVGYGKSTFYFLPQRILKDMAVAYEAASGIYGVNSSKSKTATVNEEITKIRKKYFDLYKKACEDANVSIKLNQSNDGTISFNDMSISLNNLASTIMSRDNLITLLLNDKKLDELENVDKIYYYEQLLLISELFLQLNDLSLDMSKLVLLSQIDTKRYGNNFIELNRFLYRLNSLIVNSNLFEAEDIINYYRNTFLETKLINGIIEPAEIFLSLMFRSNQSFKDAISKILLMTNRIDTNDESLNKTISNELEGSLRQQFLDSKNIDIFDLLYGNNSMAHRLAKIKTDILNGKYDGMLTQDGKIANKLLNHLGTLTRMSTDKYFAPDIITKNRINDGDKYLKLTLTVYWEELMDSPYEEIRSFANDLFYYQLATTAGNFTKNGIFGVTPIRLIKESGYNLFMRNLVKSFIGDTSIDYDDLFLNNWQNNKLVKSVELYKEAFDQESNEITQQLTVPVLFSNTLLPELNKRYPILMQLNNPSIAKNGKGKDVFQPYVKVVLNRTTPQGTLLYKLIGSVKNKQGISKPIYALVNKKGLNESGRVVKEYNKYSNSIFEFNNIPNALNAKKQINNDVLRQLISTGDRNNIKKWSEILNNIEYIDDYIPETKALNLNIFKNNTGKNIIRELKNLIINTDSNQLLSSNTYTFSDGFIIDIPFKLNTQQIELLKNLEYFYNNPLEFNNIITVSGYAGTGKTTMIGIFNKWLEHKGEIPIFSSPTHRANAVTKMNNPNSIVKTLHSIFGLSPIIDLEAGNYDLRKLKTEQIYKPKISTDQLLVIDEASMVSLGLYNFIQNFVNDLDIKVIFVGDQAQLSPVKDNNISPVFRENDSKIELTKVERTGDNPILKEATSLRNGNPLSYITEIINGEGVEYMATNSSRIDEVLSEIVNSEEFKNNPLYFKVLAATNAVVQQTNLKVREQRFGKNAPQLMPGDILMGYSNITDGEIELVRNSVDYIVDSVSEITDNTIQVLDGKSLTVKGYNIVLRNAFNGEIGDKLFVLDNNISPVKLKEISDLIEYFNRKISDAFKAHNYNSIGALQRALSEILKNTILMKDIQQGQALKVRKTLDYGYACTVHKSQGGTYNKIMYYADTVAPFEKKVQNQLDYVAVSRAKENVYIVTNHEINNKNNIILYDNTKSINDQIVDILGNDQIAEKQVQDTISIAKKGMKLEDVTPIFSSEEIAQIKLALNGNPLRVISVSRRTDPAFFSKEIIKFLEENSKKLFTDPTRVNAIEIWTKHDGMPIRNILEACMKYKVAPMVSFSITTLGDTALEKGVLKYLDLLPLIKGLIDENVLDPRTTTVRLDPILVGVTNMEDIKNVVAECKKMGITKFVTSLVLSYGYLDGTPKDRKVTSGINNALAKEGKTYDWGKYYGYDKNGKINFKPKQLYINKIGEVLIELNKDPEIRLETCAFTIKGLKASACLDPLILERITGIDVTRPDGTYNRDTSRPECMCYGCHGDMFRFNEKNCYSSCAYCYAAHSGDSSFEYYNEDGTLKDRPLTRFKELKDDINDKQLDQRITSSNKITRAITNYNRQSVLANPRTLYIFTDNTDRTSGGTQINDGWYKDKYGNGGYGSDRNPTTAVIRGLDNAAPISTMKYFYRNHPNMSVNEARWTDNNLNEFKKVIDDEINDIKLLWDSGDFDNIIVPSGDGFFNSRIANISKERTPKLYQYLRSKLIELNNYVNGAKSEVLTINVYSGTGDNIDLSNFAERPFEHNRIIYNTVEGAFLAQKLIYSTTYNPLDKDGFSTGDFTDEFFDMLNTFAKASGSRARQLGRNIRNLDINSWNAQSEQILKMMMKKSFEQNPKAKQRLLDTGDAIITHEDKYGKEQDNGRFSRLLMEIRDEFRNESLSYKYTGNLLEQADFSEFNEMREEGRNIAGICKNK